MNRKAMFIMGSYFLLLGVLATLVVSHYLGIYDDSNANTRAFLMATGFCLPYVLLLILWEGRVVFDEIDDDADYEEAIG